jgi:hypothetical protein
VNIGRWNPIKLDYRTRFPSKEKRKKEVERDVTKEKLK